MRTHPGTARHPGVLASWLCASSATSPCTDICPDRVEAAGEATGRACMSPSVWPVAYGLGLGRWASAGSACAWHGCKDRVLARLWPGGPRRVPLGRASWRGFWPARLHHFGVSRHAVAYGRACSACVMAGMLPARLRLLGLASRFRLLAGASRPWWRFRRCECFPARLRPKAAVDDRPSPPVGFLCVIAGMWPARLRLLGSASRLVEDASSRVLLARLHPKAAVGDRPSPPRWVLVLGRHVCSPG